MVIDRQEISKKLKVLRSVTPTRTSDGVIGILVANRQLVANNNEILIYTDITNDSDESFIIPTSAIDLIENLPNGDMQTPKNL